MTTTWEGSEGQTFKPQPIFWVGTINTNPPRLVRIYSAQLGFWLIWCHLRWCWANLVFELAKTVRKEPT